MLLFNAISYTYDNFHFHLPCKLVACVHRHYVFTIPEELRAYFLKDRSLLDCLFHSVRDVVLRMFSKMNKTENCTIYHSLFCHVIFYFQFIMHYF